MPTKIEVWEIADDLRRKKLPVSQRSVRDALPNRGSFSDIGPHVAEWKLAKLYRPGIELAGLPEHIHTKLAKAAAEMWEAAMQEATGQLQFDREQVSAAIAVDRELRDEALAAADRLEFEVATLRAEIARLSGELQEAKFKSEAYLAKVLDLRKEPADRDGIRKSERRRTMAFWKYAMIRLRDKLITLPEDSPGMTFDEVLEWMTQELNERAITEAQVIDRSILAKRLYERNLRENYVVKVGDHYLPAPAKARSGGAEAA